MAKMTEKKFLSSLPRMIEEIRKGEIKRQDLEAEMQGMDYDVVIYTTNWELVRVDFKPQRRA